MYVLVGVKSTILLTVPDKTYILVVKLGNFKKNVIFQVMGGEVESSGFLAGYRLLNREIGMRLKKPREDDKVPRDQQQWKAVTSLSLIDKKRELCH